MRDAQDTSAGSLPLLAIAGGLALSACAPIEPWVKPYEREHLADPDHGLRPTRFLGLLDHVFEVREGARGATGGAGGGCGCT